jgi:DNA-binding transcriptional MerR regulator
MTGLSAERIRAWEARHAAVRPVRTPGGSRRYRAADLERLRLLRDAVEAGHRIGDLAQLDEVALRACVAEPSLVADSLGSEVLWGALARLEADRVRLLLEEKRAALGTLEFARAFALPFLHEVGRRWVDGELTVAAEHLASALLSSMLGAALLDHRPDAAGPSILFATPSGEPHALGLCIAALTAAHAGAAPIYLGADVPEDDLVVSVERSRVDVLALAFVTLPRQSAEDGLRRLRRRLPERVEIWIGGAGAARCAPIRGVVNVANLDQLASHVAWKRMPRDGQET